MPDLTQDVEFVVRFGADVSPDRNEDGSQEITDTYAIEIEGVGGSGITLYPAEIRDKIGIASAAALFDLLAYSIDPDGWEETE